jgi:hypothetical protein
LAIKRKKKKKKKKKNLSCRAHCSLWAERNAEKAGLGQHALLSAQTGDELEKSELRRAQKKSAKQRCPGPGGGQQQRGLAKQQPSYNQQRHPRRKRVSLVFPRLPVLHTKPSQQQRPGKPVKQIHHVFFKEKKKKKKILEKTTK